MSKKFNIHEIISRIKKIKNVRSDGEVAAILGVGGTAVSNYKTSGNIPFERLTVFCENESISIDWLIRGEGEPQFRYNPSLGDHPSGKYEAGMIRYAADKKGGIDLASQWTKQGLGRLGKIIKDKVLSTNVSLPNKGDWIKTADLLINQDDTGKEFVDQTGNLDYHNPENSQKLNNQEDEAVKKELIEAQREIIRLQKMIIDGKQPETEKTEKKPKAQNDSVA